MTIKQPYQKPVLNKILLSNNKIVKIDVLHCNSCGEEHSNLTSFQMEKSFDDTNNRWSHCAVCPTTRGMIFIAFDSNKNAMTK